MDNIIYKIRDEDMLLNHILNYYWMRSSRILGIIKAEVCVICRSRRLRLITQTEALIIPHILREPNSIIVLLFICICEPFPWRSHLHFEFWHKQHKSFVFCIWHMQHKLVWRHKVVSYKCFQYTKKLRHNVVYAFSIFYDDVITPNLGYYRTDITISSTALNQSKLFNYFQ